MDRRLLARQLRGRADRWLGLVERRLSAPRAARRRLELEPVGTSRRRPRRLSHELPGKRCRFPRCTSSIAMTDAPKQRLIIGISGASGIVYGIRLLQLLRNTPVETHLVMTRAAEIALAHETDSKVAEIRALADVAYGINDIGAAISSGSYRTAGM